MRLSVIIPFYNEKKTIGKISEKVLSLKYIHEVIAVDDGSVDGSGMVLKTFSDTRLKMFRIEENRGKAAAVRLGMDKASGDYILVQDADLEYDPDDYCRLIAPVKKGAGNIVYGDRFPLGGENMFPAQKAANRFLTFLTNLLYGGGVKDMETCYKLIPSEVLRSLNLKENGFAIEAEITAKLLKRGRTIINVPVSYRGRSYSQGKKIKFSDAAIALWVLIKYRFFN